MKALVGAFNQEKALVGAFFVIVQPVVQPMDRFAALSRTQEMKSLVEAPVLLLRGDDCRYCNWIFEAAIWKQAEPPLNISLVSKKKRSLKFISQFYFWEKNPGYSQWNAWARKNVSLSSVQPIWANKLGRLFFPPQFIERSWGIMAAGESHRSHISRHRVKMNQLSIYKAISKAYFLSFNPSRSPCSYEKI